MTTAPIKRISMGLDDDLKDSKSRESEKKKLIEFIIKKVDVVDKLYVSISDEELFEWEN